jgi:hypothetical protein
LIVAPIVILAIGFTSALVYGLIAPGGSDDMLGAAILGILVSFASLAAGWVLLCLTVIIATFVVAYLLNSL